MAPNWSDFESFLSRPNVRLGLIDPAADGTMNLAAVERILDRRRSIPIVAYVDLSNEKLKAIGALAKRGLSRAFVHPQRDEGVRILEITRRLPGDKLAYEFLGIVEARLALLEPHLFRAVQDLFERPHRYETAADIGRECGLSIKHLYRAFRKAQLSTPKKLVTTAKILRGYAYLQDTGELIRTVSRRLGYARPRVFSEQITEIFGYPPSRLRKNLDPSEVLLNLIEWLYKPTNTSPRHWSNKS